MGRIRPAWYYERQAQEAQRRQDYFRNRTAPAESTTIQTRGGSTDLYYRSMLNVNATDHLVYKVSVYDSTLDQLTAAQAGLLTAEPAANYVGAARGSGMKPTKLHWYRGAATPRRVPTAWGTSSARYYDTAGRSHYSIPFSRATGSVDGDTITTAFNGLFGATGSELALLGAANGRAYIEWERNITSAQS